jgi:hypothetical protein
VPFVETTLDARTENDETVLGELIHELQSPRATGQPLIEVRNMSRGGLRHVYVIWDRWEECRPEVRAAIVREAFATVKGADYEKSIATTVSASVPEAVELGLLPYEVKPVKLLADGDVAAARRALLAEGASVLRPYPSHAPGALPALHFPTEQQAEAAVARLTAATPQLDWRIVITVAAPG